MMKRDEALMERDEARASYIYIILIASLSGCLARYSLSESVNN